MTAPVTLPLWLLILVLLFAAVTASTHLLFPSVRWFFRRRAERLVAELNKRLDHPIQPFKLLRRKDMIQRVIYDPEVVGAVTELAESEGVREDVAFERALRYAREIVPSFSATAYFGFGTRVARWLATSLFEVRLHRNGDQQDAEIDRDATVVYVMNHRSNFDYVLVTYLAANQTALSYAAGEWARVWPLSSLVRTMGAYFIRRNSRTLLYRKVLASYVQKATRAGVTQAVFPEGGLSRTGLVAPPKLGILSYIVDSWRPEGRDVVFIPISLNYDRVVEDRILVAAGRSERRRFRASAPEGIRFTIRYVWRRLRGRVGRFGVAAVTFGRPVSLSELAGGAEPSEELTATLGERLSSDLRADVPILTVPLIMLALVEQDAAAGIAEIGEAIAALRARLTGTPADFAIDESDQAALERELDILVLRQLLEKENSTYRVTDRDVAEFYANSVRHHFSAGAKSEDDNFADDKKRESNKITKL